MKHARQMHITKSHIEEGLDWSAAAARRANKAVGLVVIARGEEAASADLAPLQEPLLFCEWSLEPVQTFRSDAIFNGCGKTIGVVRLGFRVIGAAALDSREALCAAMGRALWRCWTTRCSERM